MRKGKRDKVIKSKRWGSEWTREEQRRKGGTPAPRGVPRSQTTPSSDAGPPHLQCCVCQQFWWTWLAACQMRLSATTDRLRSSCSQLATSSAGCWTRRRSSCSSGRRSPITAAWNIHRGLNEQTSWNIIITSKVTASQTTQLPWLVVIQWPTTAICSLISAVSQWQLKSCYDI